MKTELFRQVMAKTQLAFGKVSYKLQQILLK
jgi:hypothetical protein